MKSFTVERATWCRGGIKSRLLTEDNSRCCLGFVGKQCGVLDEDILGIFYPDNLDQINFEKYPEVFRRDDYVKTDSLFSRTCAEINDDSNITDEEREEKLIKKFEEVGLELKFI